MNNEIIKLSKISKIYNETSKNIEVLKNINLSINKGDIISLTGPSGSGKSTLLHIIALLDQPTSGEVFFKKRSFSKSSDKEKDLVRRSGISIIYQQNNLLNDFTTVENVAIPLVNNGNKWNNSIKDAEKILSMVGLSRRLNHFPTELSGGEQQRVAVARALVFDPAVVLMDEPLGALDKNLRESMQYEIKHIHESIGVTVVYVTHDQSEALTMSNRIAVFNDGKVQQLSDPAELYEKPVNSFVAEFIGENNTFNGEVTDIAKDKCKVKLANSEILANPISVKSKGEKTTVSLRPERALINPTDKMDNMFKGKIEEVIYHGDHTRVRLNLLGSSEFILKVPNSTSNLELKVSQDINIGWDSNDARALDPK